jgi:hypothetical protein
MKMKMNDKILYKFPIIALIGPQQPLKEKKLAGTFHPVVYYLIRLVVA